ncbi:HK97 gp10 family phage protein [Nonomuraea sp. NPDC050404]|uniref:HK97 gp10 family phage protein n=1 Tax=Nonomuraea sp. NPDC050404 TaxID=3155783 RepID=UPI0033DF0519
MATFSDPQDPSAALRLLSKQLQGIPKELRQKLRPALRAAAEPVVADARGRASWSTRIPRAISMSVRFSRDPGVIIRVRRSVAPHGRAYEGITGASHFVHPVHGHRDREVAEETKPYLEPAVRAAADTVLAKGVAVVDEVARENGFR